MKAGAPTKTHVLNLAHELPAAIAAIDALRVELDVLFVPGGPKVIATVLQDDTLLNFLADRGAKAHYDTSVCIVPISGLCSVNCWEALLYRQHLLVYQAVRNRDSLE
ncbi:hypothetical protein [Phyllobacterium phragmitis]|uniref:hypothetical protein n=1 Tax=Phyllobacterium phragmitis TaxID=2670329 RepID=UPI0011B1F960|nr:hypothetical protein [Phyllobacterium phragmitis]